MKYLLIDANNLAIRSAFANAELKSKSGIPTGVHFGFFQSLFNLSQRYPEHQPLIVWDGHSSRRIKESQKAVEDGIIPEVYKANRKKDPQPQPLIDFIQQSPFLKRGIGATGIPQIRLADFEADDVIASYTNQLRDSNEIVICTSDRDYFQLLHDNVILWDGMKAVETTLDSFQKEKGVTVEEYLHCCAISGDTGDNIFGIPSWGETTALKFIQKEKTWNQVLKSFEEEYGKYRLQYPDLKDDDFTKLTSILTKSGKAKYAGIHPSMPFTGVALACEEKKIKPTIPKSTLMFLMFQSRLALSFSLKKMDYPQVSLEIGMGVFNEDRLIEYFNYYDIESLMDIIPLLYNYPQKQIKETTKEVVIA